jgi:hypothetical protein
MVSRFCLGFLMDGTVSFEISIFCHIRLVYVVIIVSITDLYANIYIYIYILICMTKVH